MEEYGGPGQAIDDNIIGHIRFARWIIKATDMHSEYVTIIVFIATIVSQTASTLPLYIPYIATDTTNNNLPHHTTHLIKTDNISTRKYYTYMEITLPIVTALNHTGEKNTTKLSAPEDGHMVTRNMLSN